ncbi:MAG: hypothetical protein RLZZ528_622 [Pseudomonadota bacterium]
MTLDRSLLSLPGFLNPVAVVKTLVGIVSNWSVRRSQRHALARLDDHLLQDIGLTTVQARDEALKHFWLE